MDEGKAPAAGAKPHWWSRPRQPVDDATGAERPEALGGEQTPSGAAAPADAAPPVDAPLHAPDPYGTPPYGHPGPWAPAPPVQRPTPTPPHGTMAPFPGTPFPPPPAAPAPGGTEVPPGAPAAPPTGLPAVPPPPAAPGNGPVPTGGSPVPPPGAGARSGTFDLPPGAPLPPGTPAASSAGGFAAAPPGGAAPASPAGPAAHPGAPLGTPPPQGPWRYDPWAQDSRPPEPGAKAAPGRNRIIGGALLVALVAGGVGGGVGAYLERDGRIGQHVTLHQSRPDLGDRDPGSVAGIAARVLPGVVTIHVRGSSAQGTGTGFVLDKQGHILTNNHVVEPAGSGGAITVTFNGGQTAKATVVGRDGGYDLAVIKVAGVSGLTPLPLGNSDSVRVGDSVVAVGAPFDLAGTVTTGIISAKERPITAGGHKGDGSDVSYVDALQTDAPINPGNSGGPLVDARGRVIGINSAIRSAGDSESSGGQGGSIGLGFAIPVNQARRVAEELINTGKATHPVIGVSLDMEYSGDGARVNDKSAGAVTPGGPADQAGIKPQDVIKKVDDVPVHSGQELIVRVRSHRPGDRLTLTVEHAGQQRTVRLTLGSADAG
ncbi:S1C family serine protease [Streptomyces sp. NPDC052396]|uniref:S1C family serine protease n=1 Tax=Streptomyces sp. NPDC052396 TaxID=3365689 RepID=UPI0037D01D2E